MPILVDPSLPTGSSVALTTVWMNLASDLTDRVAFPLMSSLKVTTAQPGEVRAHVSGRLRLILAPGRAQSWDVDLPMCDRTQIEWLQSHVGDLVCARDDRGRKIYGTYLSVAVDEVSECPTSGNVSLSLQEVTHSESA